MTNTSIERVGRAIAEADGEDYMEDHARYDRRARAALRAMREPTQAILDCRDAFVSNADALAQWQTQIDTAINGK